MKRTLVVQVAVLALAMTAWPHLRAADDPTVPFTQWADAVLAHVPGTADAAVQTASALTPGDRKTIADRLGAFLFILSNPTAWQNGAVPPIRIEQQVKSKATDVYWHKLTPQGFLERAAMLHADAAMFGRRPPVDVPTATTQSPPRVRLPGPTYQAPGSMFTARDGEVMGAIVANWNWSFARTLLDLVAPIPADDTFIGIWYHATTAYMLQQGEFGEALPHLEHAAKVLPNDALVAFDRACVAESFAMNQFQQLLSDDGASLVFSSGRFARAPAGRPDIPNASDANAQARALYERAIALNPSLVEAHVRLAHELEIAGDYTAAAGQVRDALALSPPADVAFYAHLFGARAANALGHDADAEGHVRAALALYPSAGSALVAASQTALHRADPGTAVERLGRLAEPPPANSQGLDPWRQYIFGAGRIAELPLMELWHRVPPVIGQ
jgi:hypothetical protein